MLNRVKQTLFLFSAILLVFSISSCVLFTSNIIFYIGYSTESYIGWQILSVEYEGEDIEAGTLTEFTASFGPFEDTYKYINYEYSYNGGSISELSWPISRNDDEAHILVFMNTIEKFSSLEEMNKYLQDKGLSGFSADGDDGVVADYPDSLVGTEWRGSYNYYGVNVVEYLYFTSETSCKGTTYAGGDSIDITMTYTYNPANQTGTLTADSPANFYIVDDVLTMNNVNYLKQ